MRKSASFTKFFQHLNFESAFVKKFFRFYPNFKLNKSYTLKREGLSYLKSFKNQLKLLNTGFCMGVGKKSSKSRWNEIRLAKKSHFNQVIKNWGFKNCLLNFLFWCHKFKYINLVVKLDRPKTVGSDKFGKCMRNIHWHSPTLQTQKWFQFDC